MNIKKLFDVLELVISTKRKRDPDVYVFGSWYGEKFADNPKYLYLYCLKHGKNANWVTKSRAVYESMKKDGMPVYLYGTKEETKISRKAKFFFYCCSFDDLDKYHAGGATMINLWHGIPLKKIMYDDTYNYNTGKKSLYEQLSEQVMRRAFSKNYIISTSKTISKIYESAFRTDSAHILNLGQPRNDRFFDSELQKQRYGKREYNKLITYMPTMRNMGNDAIDLSQLLDLKKLDELCKKYDAIFLVKKHFCHRHETTDLSGLSNIVDMTTSSIDSQELLFSTDILITDYSSCYIDYMLLDRPIIFYAYDLEDYLSKDREMYFPYDEMTPGPKATDFEELLESIEKALKGEFGVDERFYQVKNVFYDSDNQGEVSQKIMDAIAMIE